MTFVSAEDAYLYAYDRGVGNFPATFKITDNFTWREAFTNEMNSDGFPILEVFKNIEKTARVLQQARTKIKKPFVIHCWVRQIPHNKRAKSTARYSMHLNGSAVDFHIEGMSCAQGREAILKLDLPLRIEAGTPTWIHVDTGNTYTKNFKYGLFQP